MAKCIMVQGTMSGADKRLPATALCRIFHPNVWRVAPFMNQNLALKSTISRGSHAAMPDDALLRTVKEVF